MSDLNKIIDNLSKLTVIEAAELSKKLEEKWGVTAATAAVPTATAAIVCEIFSSAVNTPELLASFIALVCLAVEPVKLEVVPYE